MRPSIKKVPAAAAYRKVIEAQSDAQDLATARGRMLSVKLLVCVELPNHTILRSCH